MIMVGCTARHMRNRTIICRLRKQKFDLEVVVVDEARVKICQSDQIFAVERNVRLNVCRNIRIARDTPTLIIFCDENYVVG